MSKDKLELKTFRFDEFNKLDERHDDVGFNSFKRNSAIEEEDEAASIDDIGEGEELDTEKENQEDLETEDTPEVASGNTDSLDVGEVDPSVEEVQNKISELGSIVKKGKVRTNDLKNIFNDIDNILKKYPID